MDTMVKVNDLEGNFIGFSMAKTTDSCKACGQLFSSHGPLAWVNADNGNHKNCNLSM